MHKAFVDYINEIIVKQKEYAKDIDEYCNNEILQGMIDTLDNDVDTHLKNYTIPKLLA